MNSLVWSDRDLEEHHVYDHNKTNGGPEHMPPPPPLPDQMEHGMEHMDHNMDPDMDHYNDMTVRVGSLDRGVGNGGLVHDPSLMSHLHMDHMDGGSELLSGPLDHSHHHHHLVHPNHETTMMMMHHMSMSEDHEIKLPTAKEKTNYLRKYALKFGLNDRGCYIACCLAGLAFFFFVVIIVMAICWPGKYKLGAC